MFLLNPGHLVRNYPDQRSREIMEKTIGFFERKGLTRLKEDYNGAVWYADFIEFCKQEGILASLMTPPNRARKAKTRSGTPGASAASPRYSVSTACATGTSIRYRCSASARSG